MHLQEEQGLLLLCGDAFVQLNHFIGVHGARYMMFNANLLEKGV
jgi:hypothetical protein